MTTEAERRKKVEQLEAKLQDARNKLQKEARAAANKRKYLFGALVEAEIENSQQLRRWLLSAIRKHPPRDKANQDAIATFIENVAKTENQPVPEFDPPPKRERKPKSETAPAPPLAAHPPAAG